MAKGKPRIFTLQVHCSACGAFLFRYKKEGPGRLMKCYESGIEQDQTGGMLTCACGQEYARGDQLVHGRPARRIIQGKVTTKGHVKK